MRTKQLLRLCLWAGCTFLTIKLGNGIRIASNVDLPTSSESDSKSLLMPDHGDLGLSTGIHATLEVKVIPGSTVDTTKGVLCVKNKSGRCIPVSSGSNKNNDIGKPTTKKPGPNIVSGFDDPIEEEPDSEDDEDDDDEDDDDEDDEDDDTKKPPKGGKRKKGTKDVPIFLGLKGVTERRPSTPPNFGPPYVPSDRDYPPQRYPDHNQHDDPYDPHYQPGPPYQHPNYPPSDFYYRDPSFYKRRRSGSDMPDYVSSRGRYSPEAGFYSGHPQRFPGYPGQRPPGGGGGYYPIVNNNRGGWSQSPGDRRGSDGYDASSWIPAIAPYPGLYGRENCDSDRRAHQTVVTTTAISVDGKLGSVLEGTKEVRSG